ncbi:hypothetical protein GCM10027258_76300 [Amycolatopsis stemonae]
MYWQGPWVVFGGGASAAVATPLPATNNAPAASAVTSVFLILHALPVIARFRSARSLGRGTDSQNRRKSPMSAGRVNLGARTPETVGPPEHDGDHAAERRPAKGET